MTKETLALARPSVAPDTIADLCKMLTYMRPARSATEAQFVETFVKPLGTAPDAYGNHWRIIGKGSPIMWSCHTDTVHKTAGKQGLEYGDGYLTTPNGSCLGADCGAGVWLMSRMIRAGIPGTYIFHREEEIGGHGSEFIASETPERLAGIKFAIAFDRKGERDIITHQYSGRTASDKFAYSLSKILDMGHAADDSGTFTDTANYSAIIPECTNLSVGYGKAHSAQEYLDVVYLTRLLKRLLKADFAGLVCDRDPAVVDPADFYQGDWRDGPAGGFGSKTVSPFMHRLGDTMADLVYENPERVADFLEACGYSVDDLIEYMGDK